MNRAQLLTRLDQAWQTFNESYAGLAESTLVEPGVEGDWSVKDIIAHVAWWEEEALKHLPVILAGKKPPRYSVTYGGIDAFNAQQTQLKRHLSVTEALQQRDDTHQRLVAYLQDVPEEQIARATPFRHRLRLDTYSHYPLHARAIREWRAQRFA